MSDHPWYNLGFEEKKPRLGSLQHNPKPLKYIADTSNFWETELQALCKEHNIYIFQKPDLSGYSVIGDGVHLFLPFHWVVGLSDEEVTARLIQGIKVSLAHRVELGY